MIDSLMVLESDPKIAMTGSNWSSQTNWTVASGSLPKCVTFQSSLSSLDDDKVEAAIIVDKDSYLDSDSTPLVLHPPSPDSTACEIKISFTEKHELRQVYVRSTARVYEIYYAPDLQSNNEYLCTVRCGIAARDGKVLCVPNIQETASLCAEGSNKELGEENVKNAGDWVEVKVLDIPVLDGRNIPLQAKSYINSAKKRQDLFEATAEITDANPCISVVLRLLSLQSKDCIYVDEIYVFGDPVASTDLENQESRNENSSGSSLMAMFLPTLMQLSKTTGLSHMNAVRKERQYFSEEDLEETHPSDSVIKNQLNGEGSITDPQEVKLTEVNGDWLGSRPEIPSQVAKMESNHILVPSQATKMECNHSAVPLQVGKTESSHGDSLGVNVERGLEQLISRMDRIEEICLSFQEKMVMPMRNIEARLQRVEQQLETMTKTFQNPGLPSCSRISAPDASCIESDTNSCDNCLGYTVTREIESDKNDVHLEVLSVSPDDMSDSANTTQLLPGLVVTAPEFPDGEDEDDNASGQEMDSSNDKGKRNSSIDDALSSALANFLSSVSLASPKYTKGLSVKASEFSNEEDDDHESKNASPSTLYEIEKNDSVYLADCEKINHTLVPTSSDIFLVSGGKLNGESNDKQSEETAREDRENGQFYSAEDDQDEVGVKVSIVAEEVGVKVSIVDEANPRTDFNHNTEEDRDRKINDGLWSNTSGISNDLLHNETFSGSSISQGGVSARTDLTVATEVPKKASREDIIENVLGFSLASSVVDFEIPLLDVKFTSQRSAVTEPFLEALLEVNSRDLSVKESSDDLPVKEQMKSNGNLSLEEQYSLVSVDDGELVSPTCNSHFSGDKDYCTLITVPVNIEGENLPGDHKSRRDEICASSLM